MLIKGHKLRKDNDFKAVFKNGRKYYSDSLGIIIVKNNLEISRFGFVVSLKISKKAVIRNKLRRQLNEIIRLNLEKIKKRWDVVVLTRPEIKDKTYQQIEETLIKLFKKANLL